MRSGVWLLAIAALVTAHSEEPWVEEEDVDETYYPDEAGKIEFEEIDGQMREKRYDKREKRSVDYVRVPRQVHQYEVHEALEEISNSAPPYEEMLAASAEHYHKVYAPSPRARYLNTEVSPGPLTFGVQPVQSDNIQVVAPASHILSLSDLPNPNVGQISVPSNAPVGYVTLSQPLSVEGDQSPAAGHHKQIHHPHSHSHSQGGGHKHQAKHHGEKGVKTSKGYKTNHYVDKGGKGHKTDELHKKQYEEADGQKKKHHDNAHHKGSHEEAAHGHRGAHFGEKKGHKKGHKTKGFHNKYHKDEFHKEHKFYDDFHKSGEHHRFGKFNAKHASNESGKKKAHHVNAGHDFVEHGKKGYSNKGHVDADHKGHKGQHGHDEHHEHHEQHGKKGGKQGGSHWAYAKKN